MLHSQRSVILVTTADAAAAAAGEGMRMLCNACTGPAGARYMDSTVVMDASKTMKPTPLAIDWCVKTKHSHRPKS